MDIEEIGDLRRLLDETMEYGPSEVEEMKQFCAEYEDNREIRNLMINYLESETHQDDVLYLSLMTAARNGYTDSSAIQEDCNIDQNPYTP